MEAKEFAMRSFTAFVISFFISVVINNILYIHVRMNPSQDIPEWITIEYFAFIYAILLGIAIFLTPISFNKELQPCFSSPHNKELLLNRSHHTSLLLLPFHC